MTLTQQRVIPNRFVTIENYADRLGGYVDIWIRHSLGGVKVQSSHPDLDGSVFDSKEDFLATLSVYQWEVA